jgi:proline iminopeptidase
MLPIRRLDDPFHPVRPARASGLLERPDGHAIYWEDAGDPALMPIILCHGGPGGAGSASRRRFYDPDKFRVILFDQRGCGKSTPTGRLEGNSLQATIADMEAIRAMLGIGRWVVGGGSWGSVVAVAYAEAHPERCLGLNLTCTWLVRAKDIDWWFQGVRAMFPELWEGFASLVPPEERGDLRAAYVRRILGDDPGVAEVAARQLHAYEEGFMHFDTVLAEIDPGRGPRYGRIFAHYAAHDFFVRDTELLDGAARIAGLPVEMVVGRYDCCCTPDNSFDLARRLPRANLVVVPGGGHYSTETAMAQAVALAPGRLHDRIVTDGTWRGGDGGGQPVPHRQRGQADDGGADFPGGRGRAARGGRDRHQADRDRCAGPRGLHAAAQHRRPEFWRCDHAAAHAHPHQRAARRAGG